MTSGLMYYHQEIPIIFFPTIAAILNDGVFAGSMPIPEELQNSWDEAINLTNSNEPEKALDLLRDAWKLTENEAQRARTRRYAADAGTELGKIDIGNQKKHWQKAHKNYREAIRFDPKNKETRRKMNKLASLMDEKAISLGAGFQLFDEGNPTPLGLIVMMTGLMLALVSFKLISDSVDNETQSELIAGDILMEVSWTDLDGISHDGKIWIELYNETPMHSQSFRANADAQRYDGTIFHRIVDGFMIQGGDFENGDGTGGHAGEFFGYCANAGFSESNICENDMTNWIIPEEFGQSHEPGVIAAARNGQSVDSAGSQFYLVDSEGATQLDGQYTAFGKAYKGEIDEIETTGIAVIDAISQVGCGINQETCTDQNKLSTYPVQVKTVTLI